MKMERSGSSESSFWTTIDLLIERKWREKQNDEYPIDDDIRTEKRLKRLKKQNSIHPDREDEPVKTIQPPDKSRMQRLQERLNRLAEEELQKRINARQLKEMDRLKKLILNGKSPLKDCPPELKEHPVFVFWRVMDKEIERITKPKYDGWRKMKRCRRKSGSKELSTPVESEETSLSTEDMFNDDNNNNNDDSGASRSSSTSYTPQGITNFKYEDEGITELKKLTTVEELYQMADRIIGISRVVDNAR